MTMETIDMKFARQLMEEKGVTAKSHHMRIKQAFKELMGIELGAGQYKNIVRHMADLENRGDYVAPEGTDKETTVETSVESAAQELNEQPVEQEAKVKTKTVKEPKPVKTPVVKQKPTNEEVLAAYKAKNPERWDRVVEVLEVSDKTHRPTRVKIRTLDDSPQGLPQFRDIAVQDLFQVRYSVEGQRKAMQKLRSERAKARTAERKQAVARLAAEIQNG